MLGAGEAVDSETTHQVRLCGIIWGMPAGSSLRERKKQRTSAAIARATVALVAERGLGAVRVEDVCELAEVSRSTFFRYFDSKEAALVAGVHEGRLEALLDALARRPPDEGPLVAFRWALLEAVADWREQRESLLLEAAIRAKSVEVQVRALGEAVAWEGAVASAMEGRLARGTGGRLRAQLLAATAMAALRIANEGWLADGARQSPVRWITAALDAVDELMEGAR